MSRESDRKFLALRESGYRGPIDQDGNKVTGDPVAHLRQVEQNRRAATEGARHARNR